MSEKTFGIDFSVFRPTKDTGREADVLTGRDLAFGEVVPRIVRQHLLPMWPYLVLAYLAGILVSATTGGIPFLIQITSDKIVVEKDLASLSVIPIAVVLLMAFKSAGEYTSAVAQFFISGKMDISLKREAYQATLNADHAWLQRAESGRLLAGIMGDTNRIAGSASVTIITLGKSILTALILLGTMFYMDPLLTTASLVALPFVLIFFRKQRKKVRQRTKRQMQQTGDLSSMVIQAIRAVREVKAYQREAAELDRFTDSLRRSFEFQMQLVRAQSASGPITQFLAAIGIALAIWYGGYRGITGTMTPGEFMGFVTAAMLLYPPLKQIATLQTTLTTGIAAASRIFPIIDNIPVIRDRADARPLEHPKGAITFENVTFGYERDIPALRNVSFDIEPGKRVAFVGASGAGKSTVMNLMMRFYEADSGRVLIDGHDITQATLNSVRGASALVSQEPLLFEGTVRENIAYGAPGASDTDMKSAARLASADTFIEALPHGLDSRIGEGGNSLSGGQKQRLAIARALLTRSPILLLDEPTSALDPETERALESVLHDRMEGRTVVMIAHRLSTVRRADCIYVMQDGHIVEQGTHDDLLAAGGVYARLHGSDGTIAEKVSQAW